MGKNSQSERKQTTRRNLIKACGAGAVVSFSSMPAIAVEEGSPDDLLKGTHPFITIDITATELTSQQQNRSNPRNFSELSSIVSCIDYRSFGKPNGKQPTDMGPSKTFLTNYRDNRIDLDMNEGVVACGSGLHPADSGSVRFPAIPKEGKPTGESKYLGGTDPFEIGVSLSPQTARLTIEGSEYDCHVNNREEFAIEKAIDGTEDVVLSIGVNHHGRQKMIAHPDKHLFPITETTGQMMDEVSSQANQNANSNEAEIAMKRYSNEGAFAVEFNGGPQ